MLKVVQPQFISLKQRKGECMTVASWRDPSPPPTSSPPTVPVDAKQNKKRRSRSAKAEEQPDTFLVRCAVTDPSVTAQAVDELMRQSNLIYDEVFELPAPMHLQAPTKKSEGEEGSAARPSADDTPPPQSAPSAPAVQPNLPIPILDEDDDMPEITLPPSVPATLLDSSPLVCVHLFDPTTADNCSALLSSKFADLVFDTQTVKNANRNTTLVVKSLPFSVRNDRVLEELMKAKHAPVYVRPHRSERGVFKCVAFLKYVTRDAALKGKLELERYMLGNKPLKIEYKKRSRVAETTTGTADSNTNSGSTDKTDKLRREELRIALYESMEQHVRDLKVSRDNEGMTYPKNALSKEEQRYPQTAGSHQRHDVRCLDRTGHVEEASPCGPRYSIPGPAPNQHSTVVCHNTGNAGACGRNGHWNPFPRHSALA